FQYIIATESTIAYIATMMSSSLLGIALVVDDINKGCNLAFRYPAPPTSLDHVSSFHKLSAPLIAKLFRPKNALCNQSFELVIDDLRFISYPVLVAPRAGATAGHAATANSVSSSATSGASSGNSGASTGNNQGNAAANNSAATNKNETTMFNIIFALDELEPQRAGEHERAEESVQRRKRNHAAYGTVAAQLANALLHEELRSGFVSREVRELLHIRDELAQNERLVGGSNGTGMGGAGSGSGSGGAHHRKDGNNAPEHTNTNIEVDPQTLIDVSLGKSVLANDLKSVYHGLDENGTVHVVINRWVKLSLTLTESVSLRMQALRPYHTLLLLADEDKILDSLPVDHSQQLRLLIEAANPLKSFQELTLETSIPLHQLFRLSAHLVYWGFGRVIDTITMHNIFQVHPKADLRSQSALALEFRRKFAPHELCEVLSSFSGSRRIGEYMKNLSASRKIEYVHMLVWLLQHDFIIQLHRYVYFMIPPETDQAPEIGSFERHPSFSVAQQHQRHRGDNNQALSVIHSDNSTPPNIGSIARTSLMSMPNAARPAYGAGNPLTFTDQEREYLDRIATTNPVFTLFKRLCVYFHGQYHLEEIMWRENVSRSELRTVLSTYQDIIVCCLHE
ncbi:TPA: hypothetical protein N0F65_008577, partial [Lagenidium giganteum]